jgi:plasmid stabilization system protein ParE
MRVEFLDAARDEFLDATRWYAERSPESAARFVGAVDDTVVRVSEYPKTGRALTTGREVSARLRRTPIRGFPFSLIYATEPGLILVIAVAHGSRRPGYWRRRRK